MPQIMVFGANLPHQQWAVHVHVCKGLVADQVHVHESESLIGNLL